MNKPRLDVLVVGATGSIGRLVVAEALRQGHGVRALVRSPEKALHLPERAKAFVGDLTQPGTLADAVKDIGAVVFTHGSDGGGKRGSETVDFGGVRNILHALGPNRPRVALMTAIGVTDRLGSYNRSTEAHDWKRRGERLVRAGGYPYTIVRPGWFDYNGADEHKLVFLQGDTRHAGNSSDGVIARQQIAEVLVASLTTKEALRKTFELVAVKGQAQRDLGPLFAALTPDAAGSLDGVRDMANMPLADEPGHGRKELEAFQERAAVKSEDK